MAVPLTAIGDNGFDGPTYSPQGNWYWSGQPETLDGMTVAQIYTVIMNLMLVSQWSVNGKKT